MRSKRKLLLRKKHRSGRFLRNNLSPFNLPNKKVRKNDRIEEDGSISAASESTQEREFEDDDDIYGTNHKIPKVYQSLSLHQLKPHNPENRMIQEKRKRKYNELNMRGTGLKTKMRKRHASKKFSTKEKKNITEMVSQKEEKVPTDRLLVSDYDYRHISEFHYFLVSQFLRFQHETKDNLDEPLNKKYAFDNRSMLAKLVCRHCEKKKHPFYFAPSSLRNLGSRIKKIAFEHLLKCSKCPGHVKRKLSELEATQTLQWIKCKPNAESKFYDRVWSRLNMLEVEEAETTCSSSEE